MEKYDSKDKKDDILDDFSLEVKGIEEQAEKIIAEANQKKTEIIEKARADSVLLLEKKQKELEKNKEDKVHSEKEKINKKRQEILSDGKKSTDAFEKQSRKNLDKAVSFVVEKIEAKIKND